MDKSKIYKKHLEALSTGLHILEDKPDETPGSTLSALWLTAAGNPSSAKDVPFDKLPDISSAEAKTLKSYIKRRIAGEPLAHITERQTFLGIELLAGPGALIPRKETEILAIAALGQIEKVAKIKEVPLVIDVCTGAGNLAIVYANKFDQIKVLASDLSLNAVSLANKNVQFCNLEHKIDIFQGDLLGPFNHPRYYNKVDIITCNPPYISSAKVKTMEDEIASFEPELAFDGGPFGIKILKQLVNDAPKYLNENGCLIFEVGLGQGEAVSKLINKTNQFNQITPVYDSDNQIRAISAYV